ncbi:MAG: hypothetical protein AB7I19_09050 [Planctomycetota bacterium]
MRGWAILAVAGLLLAIAVVGPGRVLRERAVPDPALLFEEASPRVSNQSVPLSTPPARTPAVESAPAVTTKPTQRGRLPRWRVVGRVQLDDGSPAPRAKVVLGQDQGIADMLGNFSLLVRENLAPNAALRARFEGHEVTRIADFGARLVELDPKVPVGPLTLTVGERLPTIRGVVVDKDGHPQKGWRVFARIPDPAPDHHDSDLLLFVDGTRSDREGRFELAAAGRGRNIIQTHHGALRIDHVVEVDASDREDLRLVVPATKR